MASATLPLLLLRLATVPVFRAQYAVAAPDLKGACR
jgi:hypothetical protein